MSIANIALYGIIFIAGMIAGAVVYYLGSKSLDESKIKEVIL